MKYRFSALPWKLLALLLVLLSLTFGFLGGYYSGMLDMYSDFTLSMQLFYET